jgi:hypothetical protein
VLFRSTLGGANVQEGSHPAVRVHLASSVPRLFTRQLCSNTRERSSYDDFVVLFSLKAENAFMIPMLGLSDIASLPILGRYSL